MAKIQGEIIFRDSRDVKSKKTGKTYKAYSLKLKLADGELSDRIDCGFDPPKFDKGDYVAIEVVHDDKGYAKAASIEAAERPAAPKAAARSNGSGEATAPEASEGADRQTQIVLQHSQEMAIAEVALLIANNALPLSSAAGKAGTVKRFEEIHKTVQKLTVELYFDVVTGRLLDSVADAGDVELEDVGSLPPAANDAKATAPATGTDD